MKKYSDYMPRLIAWEVTRRCKLKCRHCRAEAADHPYPGELSTSDIKRVMENIAGFAKPVIILTGGEPMIRNDIYEISSYGDRLGLKMVMAPCGQMVTLDAVRKMKDAGIKRISLSIDGGTPDVHDAFRGVEGSFDDVISAIENARLGGLSFQINTTVTKLNLKELPAILTMAEEMGADSFHPFLLVPTGRGRDLDGLELTPDEYEETLRFMLEVSRKSRMSVKPTCAPHYLRLAKQVGEPPSVDHGINQMSRGCLGGISFAFISHTGIVQICGFLDVECGDLKKSNYNFKEIWDTSKVFLDVRDKKRYKGKCGICEYHEYCGGCRARAYLKTGDYLMAEPFCTHIPAGTSRGMEMGSASEPESVSLKRRKTAPVHSETDYIGLDPAASVSFLTAAHLHPSPTTMFTDADILTALQDDLPICPRPFAPVAKRFGISEDNLIRKMAEWKRGGLIRRLSAHINAEAIGFESALVAFEVPDVDKASAAIERHPGISHSYERDHRYNIWFTIKMPREIDMRTSVQKIADAASAKDFLIFPSVKNYKLDVKFDLSGMGIVSQASLNSFPLREREGFFSPSMEEDRYCHGQSRGGGISIGSQEDIKILEFLNMGVEIVPEPFKKIAECMDISEEKVLRRAAVLKEMGVLRQFRVVLNHNAVGLKANAMVVWDVEPSRVHETGRMFAAHEFVSHCYERKRSEHFPFNLYTMLHAQSEGAMDRFIKKMVAESYVRKYAVLRTKKELLKRKTTLLKESYQEN